MYRRKEPFHATPIVLVNPGPFRNCQPRLTLAENHVRAAPDAGLEITAALLGSKEFRTAHHVRYAYVSGSMYKAIASPELVARMANAGLLGYFGTGGLKLERIEAGILSILSRVRPGAAFGANLICNLIKPEMEDATVDIFFRHGIERVEASAYMQITPSLIRYRVRGLREEGGRVLIPHKLMAKVSRPEVALQFLSPPPAKILQRLVQSGAITAREAELAAQVPMADELCVEADSGGHTDNGVAYALMPAMLRMRDESMKQNRFADRIRVGAAGGIGTPHAVAASFLMGAEFVLTGSINQCTVESGTSDLVKDMLSVANVQDTAMAPAGDMFEIGAKVQVLSKGVFFPARANKLYDLYRQYESIEQIDSKTRQQLETRYFKRTFDEIYAETKEYYSKVAPEQIDRAEKNPKFKMALIFRWYFVHTNRVALKGIESEKVDFQVHTGPAIGAFNQWVRGTKYEDWRNRHVDELAELLMNGAAEILRNYFAQFARTVSSQPGEALHNFRP